MVRALASPVAPSRLVACCGLLASVAAARSVVTTGLNTLEAISVSNLSRILRFVATSILNGILEESISANRHDEPKCNQTQQAPDGCGTGNPS